MSDQGSNAAFASHGEAKERRCIAQAGDMNRGRCNSNGESRASRECKNIVTLPNHWTEADGSERWSLTCAADHH